MDSPSAKNKPLIENENQSDSQEAQIVGQTNETNQSQPHSHNLPPSNQNMNAREQNILQFISPPQVYQPVQYLPQNQQLVYYQGYQQMQQPNFVGQIPPPPYYQQVFSQIPSNINPSSAQYRYVMEQKLLSCPRCQAKNTDVITFHEGHLLYTWVVCLFIFTGVFCWIPCCIDDCKQVKVTCGKCGATKVKIQKQCC